MRMLTVQTASVQMDRPLDCFRLPARHVLSRTDDFEQKFDFSTLFYDVFWSAGGAEVLCIGPPFRFGADAAATLQFVALPSGIACQHVHERGEGAAENSRSLFRIRTPTGTTGLEIIIGQQRHISAIQPNLSAVFADQDVLLVLSQNNRLEWIIDWINYHARLFGFRAVLFLDNRSTAYELDQIAQAIRENCAIDTCVVMAVDFPYGPLGNKNFGGRTDSNFLQVGIYEAARHRFLTDARMVANFDIDELLVLRGGGDLWSIVHGGRRPVVVIPRFNTLGRLAPGVEPRHALFDLVSRRSAVKPKWIVQPRFLSVDTQLHIHSVGPAKKRRMEPGGPLFIAHQLQISNGWNDPKRLIIDEEGLAASRTDSDLREHLDRAFPADGRPAPHLWSVEGSRDANYLCHCAARALNAGDANAALHLARHATAVDADHYPGILLCAKALRALGQDAEAAAAERRLVELRPENPRFHAVMARYHARGGKLDRALASCEQGLTLAPDNAELLALRATYVETAATLAEKTQPLTTPPPPAAG